MLAVAVECVQIWFESEVIRDPRGASSSYTRGEFLCAVGFVFLAPAATILVLRGSFDTIFSSKLPRRVVFCALCALVSGAVVALWLSIEVADSNGLVRCWFVRCAGHDGSGIVATTGVAYAVVSVFCLVIWVPRLMEAAKRVAAGEESSIFRKNDHDWVTKRRAREATGLVVACVGLSLVFVASVSLPPAAAAFDPASIRSSIATATVAKRFDVVVWYGFVGAIGWVGLVARRDPRVARFLSARRGRASAGEALFWGSLVATLAYEVAFWWRTRRTDSALETGGIVLGQLANALFGLLLFPVSRNSALVACFGVGYEHLVGFHRVLGWAAIATILAHAAVFCAAKGGGGGGGIQDWTTALAAVVAAVSLPLLVATSFGAVRRRRWEIFQVFHYLAFPPLLVATLWHATAAWYYVLGGLGFSVVDHALRFAKAARRRIIDARVVAGVVVVAYDASSSRRRQRTDDDGVVPTLFVVPHHSTTTKKRKISWSCPGAFFFWRRRKGGEDVTRNPAAFFDPGQYAWIRVVGLPGWHPVSYSSSPHDATVTHHVCVRGPREWSSRLAATIVAGYPIEDLIVDGPYGSPPPLLNRRVLFLAGGIGITPCASIFRTLLLESSSTSKAARLVWAAKRREIFDLFADDLHLCALASAPSTRRFSAALFETAGHTDDEENGQKSLATTRGRPDLHEEVRTFLLLAHQTTDVLVFACGPPSFVQAARAAAAGGADFHAETFEL
ncbi:hypothetical protein CTAYLR_004416 [Chrysophaeum taylorii]|uniref:FAD-binding FR-type domain-containing protein n=1 Tax=Chrysophaeum taylorii TaxID=2483200 RepID=A0AAD7UN87_9STRA|nr:hypothetical protein CTAYLR_004416 [Chrysophaeum taylorii]